MITAHLVGNDIFFTDPATGEPAREGWWTKHPRLALYIAANCDENCACPSVGADEISATPVEMARAEAQLEFYPNRLIYEMGYYSLVPGAGTIEDMAEFMPHEIVNRLY